MKYSFINVVWTALLTVASIAYLALIAGHVPDKYALVVNFMLVPFLFGCLGLLLIDAPLVVRFILLAILPLAHVIYFGADSAKPGLENMIGVVEYVFICMGVVTGSLAKKFGSKHSPRRLG